jgi:hypothetical protein
MEISAGLCCALAVAAARQQMHRAIPFHHNCFRMVGNLVPS